MSSIAPRDIGKMVLADDIDLLVSRRPGLTELALAKFLFGRTGYQQRVNSTCRHLFREGHFIDLSLVADVEGQKVRLSANAAVAVTMEEEQSSKPV
jgi:hypothetical protein